LEKPSKAHPIATSSLQVGIFGFVRNPGQPLLGTAKVSLGSCESTCYDLGAGAFRKSLCLILFDFHGHLAKAPRAC
jgi:hypothetical protein